MKDFIITMSKFIILVAVLVFLGVVIRDDYDYQNEKIYNQGVCTECGGKYEFISADKGFDITYYYYKCDKCDKIIELRK